MANLHVLKPTELLLRYDRRAGIHGQPRLRPDDRPDDGPHVVLAVGGHADSDPELMNEP